MSHTCNSLVRLDATRRIALVSCLAFTLGSTTPSAQLGPGAGRPALATPTGMEDFLRPLVADQLERGRIAGAVVVAVEDGAVLFSGGFGLADVAAGRRMGPETVVRIGSLTKTVTAVAVMQLVEAGRLDLDRDVTDYLAFEVPAAKALPPVTLRRLLSHRTGFEDRRGAIGALTGPRPPVASFAPGHMPPRMTQDQDLVAYSNHNATLAAAVVEAVSGQSFERYLEEHVFRPLGMDSTSARQPLPKPLEAPLSLGYVRADLPPTALSSASATIFEVGSTVISTTGADMAKLLVALLDDDPSIVSRASFEAMMAPQARTPVGFVGLGLYSPPGLGANPFVGHDGGTGGFQSTLAMLPSERFGIFAAYNSSGTIPAPAELLRLVAERFVPQLQPTSHDPPAEAIPGSYAPTRRVESNFFALRALFEQVSVRPAASGGVRIGPAAIPVGGLTLERVGSGRYRGPGIEASFAGTTGGVMQLGAPVHLHVRVPWWESAGLVVPGVMASLGVAISTLVAWPMAAIRRRSQPSAPDGARLVTRLALLLYLVAIAGAVWLVVWGWPLAALSSPLVRPLAYLIHAAAWSAIVLTPFASWRLALGVYGGPGIRARGRDVVLIGVLAVLAAFCMGWRIAGTTVQF